MHDQTKLYKVKNMYCIRYFRRMGIRNCLRGILRKPITAPLMQDGLKCPSGVILLLSAEPG